MNAEGKEPWRDDEAEIRRRLNLRPFKRAEESENEACEADETEDNTEYTDNTEDTFDDAEAAENIEESGEGEDENSTEEENEENNRDEEDDEADGENTDPFEDEPFFAPDEEEEEEPKKKKRTVGDARRDDIKRKRKLTEKEKRRRQRKKKIIKIALFATVSAALIAAAAVTYFTLIVDSIEVYGCTHYDAEELIKASGLSVGKHMWLERVSEAESRMEQNAYIATADVIRVYPNKLVVNITEREEAAVLVGMNTQAVIDKDGYVLYIGARADYSGLIQISGMGSSGYHVNQRLGEESDFNSRTMITLLEAVYSAGLENEITCIELGNPLSINMETASGVTIHLGQSDNAEEKLASFKTVLPTLKSMGYASDGTLDLSAQGDPVYSPEKTAEPTMTAEPTTAVTDNTTTTEDPSATPTPTPDPNSTPAASNSASPETTPARTPSPTDAFSG